MRVPADRTAQQLKGATQRMFELGSRKTMALDRRWNTADGAPVFTVRGKYTARGWTQWTQGFQYGNALLCFDVTGDPALLEIGARHTLRDMPEHLTHLGVHDHGFNTMSTYGQMRRLMLEGRIPANDWQMRFYELAIKASGAVQAARWTALPGGAGYIHSFNGPHSLFIDTMRTLRVCGMAHLLGHTLLGEQDKAINLLERVIRHAQTTARYNIYDGTHRDGYDVPELRGRTVHECLFNVTNGCFRAPSSQQGYSPFTTWTRGLAWAMLGFAEQYEFAAALPAEHFEAEGMPKQEETRTLLLETARATCDFYIEQGSSLDGVCYWDTGAPTLYRLGDWRAKLAEPYNQHEPVDSSASAIAAQGLLRLGHALGSKGERYTQAGLAVASTLFQEPYLSTDADHEGLLLHSIYHHPNGWDFVPAGSVTPYGESSMWGDYHLLELALLVRRMAAGGYTTFFQ